MSAWRPKKHQPLFQVVVISADATGKPPDMSWISLDIWHIAMACMTYMKPVNRVTKLTSRE
jgi:hypothetical protein